MKNIPNEIFLQVGEISKEEKKDLDFAEIADNVTWCADSVSKDDIPFVRKVSKPVNRLAAEYNGRSRACTKCPFMDKHIKDICFICSKSFVEGFKKGYKLSQNQP